MPKLSDSQMSTIKKLREAGEVYHKAGKQGEAANTLAIQVLGIK